MADCCQTISELRLGYPFNTGCVISVSANARPEIIMKCQEEVIYGPTIGSVSVSAYATNDFHVGCPGRAGVSLNWQRRYDCEKDVVYFIPTGEGASYLMGDVEGLATIRIQIDHSFRNISASAQGGPSSIYTDEIQYEGYGLVYSGDPVSFNTGSDTLIYPNFGVGSGDMYLQSFSVEFTPGEIPVANYSFAFAITG